jgi:hypothetical protein
MNKALEVISLNEHGEPEHKTGICAGCLCECDVEAHDYGDGDMFALSSCCLVDAYRVIECHQCKSYRESIIKACERVYRHTNKMPLNAYEMSNMIIALTKKVPKENIFFNEVF